MELDTKRNSDSANKMWGGRFSSASDPEMLDINSSIDIDWRLYKHDIAGSIAHARMLANQEIISSTDFLAIESGLLQIKSEIDKGNFEFSRELEDIHMNIEARLIEIIGDPAKKLHTARSRNDQVATSFRLWLIDEIAALEQQVKRLQGVLSHRALDYYDYAMPGFTHLQPAQPITFGHHLLAYVEILDRDRSRLTACRARINECPLGAGALAGTGFDIDRQQTALELGFARPAQNSLDAVSSRDFALEALSALSIMAINLSRLAEEITIWVTPQFGFVTLDDKFSTGSSIMPQKRNPDAAELVRGYSGRICSRLTQLLMVVKGLPLAYCKDLQDDKIASFSAIDDSKVAISAMTGMMKGMTANREAMSRATEIGFITATDMADWLVREAKLTFRDAHHITGEIVALADAKSCQLHELELRDLQAVEPRITIGIFDVLSILSSLNSRDSEGGPAPRLVKEQANRWINQLESEQ